jgi:hypothetical protein
LAEEIASSESITGEATSPPVPSLASETNPPEYEYATDQEEYDIDPVEQYDLQDPDPRRRRRHTGRMPAGLARYWASHGRKSRRSPYWRMYDPRRRRRHHAYPVDRRRRRSFGLFHPRRISPARYHPRVHHVVYHPRRMRHRRYDPSPLSAINTTTGRAFLQPIFTVLGGILHNALVARYPKLAGGFKTGTGAVGYLGLAGGIIGAIADRRGNSALGHVFNDIGSGMLTEAVNAPGLEAITTVPTQNAQAGNGVRSVTGPRTAGRPYAVTPLMTYQPGAF